MCVCVYARARVCADINHCLSSRVVVVVVYMSLIGALYFYFWFLFISICSSQVYVGLVLILMRDGGEK